MKMTPAAAVRAPTPEICYRRIRPAKRPDLEVTMETVAGRPSGAPTMPRRPNALGVHSLNRFVFTVPDLAPAEAFYRAFGLDARRDGNRLTLYAHGHPLCWASVYANGEPKRLQYLSFSAYTDDLDALAQRVS